MPDHTQKPWPDSSFLRPLPNPSLGQYPPRVPEGRRMETQQTMVHSIRSRRKKVLCAPPNQHTRLSLLFHLIGNTSWSSWLTGTPNSPTTSVEICFVIHFSVCSCRYRLAKPPSPRFFSSRNFLHLYHHQYTRFVPFSSSPFHLPTQHI